MRQFKQPGSKPAAPARSGLSKAEKRKIMALFIGVVLVGYMILESITTSSQYRDEESGGLPLQDEMIETSVLVPEIDGKRIDALVRDTEQIDRVALESVPLDLLLHEARAMTARHFEAMQAKELTSESVARLLESPSEQRGKAMFARGKVDSLRTRRRSPEQSEEYIGRLILDDGSPVYFLVLEAPEDPLYLRVDGLFFKNYSDELYENPGEWLDGPLLVGPRAIDSFESLASQGEFGDFEWTQLYEVKDARLNVDPPVVIRESPFRAMWHLMAFVRDLPEGSIDWENAPELTVDLLDEMNSNPDKWRWQPLNIPISRVQDARVKRAGENPARIEKYTQGWIGNATWNNVIHFRSPDLNTELKVGDYFKGTGFFLHNFAYDPKAYDLRTAPFFVFHSVEKFEPEEDPNLVFLAYASAGGSVLLAGAFIFLLFRDKKKAKALQDEIVRRRRARRAKQNGSQPKGGGSFGATTT